MKKIAYKFFQLFSLLITHLYLINDLVAQQHPCGTIAHTTDSMNQVINTYRLSSAGLNNVGPYTIRLAFHIVRENNGNGGLPVGMLDSALAILKANYAPHNICFSLKKIDFIDNTSIYNANPNGVGIFLNPASNISYDSDALNIYVSTNPSKEAAYVKGLVFPVNKAVVGGNIYWGPINKTYNHLYVNLAHEIGHCLGLEHTHNGFTRNILVCDPIPGINPTPHLNECFDGTNCSTANDFVCDTPPDPNDNTNYLNDTLCTSTVIDCNGSPNDYCGFPFNPLRNNIMSYYSWDCLNSFTNGQGERMRNFIVNSPLLQSCTVPNHVFIQNKVFNTNEQILYAAPQKISVGQNVNVNNPSGPVIVNNENTTTFKAQQEIALLDGFSVIQNNTGTFASYIDTFCCVLNQTNSSRIKSKNVGLPSIAPYKPMLNNSSWLFYTKNLSGGPDRYFLDVMKGDSLFNSVLYKKIDRYAFDLFNDTLFWDTNWSFTKLMREDVVSRKVYGPTTINGIATEILIFDFNLNANDTFYVTIFSPVGVQYIVDYIDSVLLADGYHRRTNFKPNAAGIVYTWIEGVCNVPLQINNPFNSGYFGFTSYFLLCSYQDSSVIFNDLWGTTYYACNDLFNFTSKIKTEVINLFPNPNNMGIFNLKGLAIGSNYNINIYDVNGKKLYNKIEDNSKEITIDVSYLNNGLYFMHINQQRFKIIIAK